MGRLTVRSIVIIVFEIKILNGQPAACESIELLATLLYIDKGFDTTLVPFIYLFKKGQIIISSTITW